MHNREVVVDSRQAALNFIWRGRTLCWSVGQILISADHSDTYLANLLPLLSLLS